MEEISKEELAKLREKARLYDEIMAKRADAAKRSAANRTLEARKASAQKAATTRWQKTKSSK